MTNLDQTFAALADPKRRAIVARLVRGDATIQKLAEPFGISLYTIARHLKVLENASLVTADRPGKRRKCRLTHETLASAAKWIDFHRTFRGDVSIAKAAAKNENGSRSKGRRRLVIETPAK
jgi:DNA-binding transcriptional ArsR family regulator